MQKQIALLANCSQIVGKCNMSHGFDIINDTKVFNALKLHLFVL
jgi:hypothetical protein